MTRRGVHSGWRPATPTLGRGLDSLLGESGRDERGGTRTLSLDQIEPDPDQPRRHFDPDALAELSRSIAERGVIQPLVVRPHGNRFRLVAGERRWRASRQAGLTDVPVVVRELSDAEVFEIALIENIQRADLNAIEEAQAYRRLATEFGHSQEALARIVGKSRSHVANLLRLLDLPEPVREMVADGRLSMGHARAVLGADDPLAAAQAVVADRLTVRDTEARVRKAKPAKAKAPRRSPTPDADAEKGGDEVADADLMALGRQLSDRLDAPVTVSSRGGAGEVVIRYHDLEQLDRICQRLSGSQDDS